jgi:AhpD family alkylhydroperoxidase
MNFNRVFKDALSQKKTADNRHGAQYAMPLLYKIEGQAVKNQASDQEIIEAIYVAFRFAMGGPYAYSSIAFEAHDALEHNIPLTEGHFFKKDITKEINEFSKCSGDNSEAFKEFTKKVFAEGALSKDFKRGLIGLACGHMTKCPYCIRGCVKDARSAGITKEQMAEAINVGMVMSAGACFAYTSIAMDTLAGMNEKSKARAAK